EFVGRDITVAGAQRGYGAEFVQLVPAGPPGDGQGKKAVRGGGRAIQDERRQGIREPIARVRMAQRAPSRGEHGTRLAGRWSPTPTPSIHRRQRRYSFRRVGPRRQRPREEGSGGRLVAPPRRDEAAEQPGFGVPPGHVQPRERGIGEDRKSTRLNSSHVAISSA